MAEKYTMTEAAAKRITAKINGFMIEAQRAVSLTEILTELRNEGFASPMIRVEDLMRYWANHGEERLIYPLAQDLLYTLRREQEKTETVRRMLLAFDVVTEDAENRHE